MTGGGRCGPLAGVSLAVRLAVLGICGVALLACLPAAPGHPSPAATGRAGAGPPTVALDGAALLAARARLTSGDPTLRAALSKLTAAADRDLGAGPWSVMDKVQVPPGGDRHEYYSQSIYSWPNPQTANGLPWVTRDGDRNPAAAAISDAAEWSHLVDACHRLALAWFYTGDERYATRAGQVLRTWFLAPATRMNPDLLYAQRVPGVNHSTPGGIIDFADLALVVDAAALLRGSPGWAATDETDFRGWLSRYLDWLRGSPEGRTEAAASNNHSSWYDTQTAAIGVFLGRQDVARQALTAGRANVAAQVRPDGSQPLELARATSWNYSVYNLRALCRLAAIGRAAGIDLWVPAGPGAPSLRTAVDFLVPTATGARPWTAGRQAGGLDPSLALPVLHAAADAGDPVARTAIPQVAPGGTAADPWLLSPAA